MHIRISEFLQSRIDAGDFPSAVYLVAEKGEIVFHDALGYAVVEPERIEPPRPATRSGFTVRSFRSVSSRPIAGLTLPLLTSPRVDR